MSDTLSTAEPTNLLLASNKVDGTKVATRDGETLGTVFALMINKRTGGATYAVLSLGGFLGIGKSYYPLPFDLLTYDHVADGYIVTIDQRLLEDGPSWSKNSPGFNQAYADRVLNYYGVKPADLEIGAMIAANVVGILIRAEINRYKVAVVSKLLMRTISPKSQAGSRIISDHSGIVRTIHFPACHLIEQGPTKRQN